jgi:Ca2+-binding RTX toxin-like protein
LTRRLTLGAAGAIAVSLVLASSAGAAVSCTTDGFGRPEILISGQGETVGVRVVDGAITYDPGANGDAFLPCGATVTSTDTIFIGGEAGTGQGLLIDLGGGQFAPGFSTVGDPSGVPEIEWSVDLRGGSAYIPDFLWVKGGEGPDGLLAAGSGDAGLGGVTQGLELNWNPPADEDLDVTLPGRIPEVIKLLGQGGPDSVSTSALPGQPYLDPAYLIQLEGGPGDDQVQGTQRRNTKPNCRLQTLFVRLTFDRISRNKRFECLVGGADRDTMRGQSGDDKILGQDGPDNLFGDAGDDRLNGGDGVDRCNTGTGRDTERNCEK